MTVIYYRIKMNNIPFIEAIAALQHINREREVKEGDEEEEDMDILPNQRER